MHQQTQRIYAVADAYEGNQALILLDPDLRVVATAETYAGHRPVIDVAVHGDQVFVLTDSHHVEGSGLRLLDLDGRFLRTIAAGRFRNPWAVAVSHGRAFVIDGYDEDDEEALTNTVLRVIEIHSGSILQTVPLELSGRDNSSIVDGDEIYISDFPANKVTVLRFAGSEA